MQVHVGLFGQELLDLFGLVRREVVEDDVDVLTLGLVCNEFREKRDEFR